MIDFIKHALIMCTICAAIILIFATLIWSILSLNPLKFLGVLFVIYIVFKIVRNAT